MTGDRDAAPEADAPEQTWGQGEGRHEPTIPADDAEEQPTSYAHGTAHDLDDPSMPLTREDEGRNR
jgi:hypothetical protein